MVVSKCAWPPVSVLTAVTIIMAGVAIYGPMSRAGHHAKHFPWWVLLVLLLSSFADEASGAQVSKVAHPGPPSQKVAEAIDFRPRLTHKKGLSS